MSRSLLEGAIPPERKDECFILTTRDAIGTDAPRSHESAVGSTAGISPETFIVGRICSCLPFMSAGYINRSVSMTTNLSHRQQQRREFRGVSECLQIGYMHNI
jgi:hypothetical protein